MADYLEQTLEGRDWRGDEGNKRGFGDIHIFLSDIYLAFLFHSSHSYSFNPLYTFQNTSPVYNGSDSWIVFRFPSYTINIYRFRHTSLYLFPTLLTYLTSSSDFVEAVRGLGDLGSRLWG